jgi:hypothetical protein
MLGNTTQALTEDKSVIDFPMDGAPSEGCSTTTILAQLSIEPDAGAGAVHTITLMNKWASVCANSLGHYSHLLIPATDFRPTSSGTLSGSISGLP